MDPDVTVLKVPCPDCDGAGEITIVERSPLGYGHGHEWHGPCHTCRGSGEVYAWDLGELGLDVIGPAAEEGRKTQGA